MIKPFEGEIYDQINLLVSKHGMIVYGSKENVVILIKTKYDGDYLINLYYQYGKRKLYSSYYGLSCRREWVESYDFTEFFKLIKQYIESVKER